jgi:hypothetical protein
MRYRFTSLCAYLQMLIGVVLIIGGPAIAALALVTPFEPWSALVPISADQVPSLRVVMAVVAVLAGLGFGTGSVLRGRMALISIQQRRALAAANRRLRQLEATFDRYESNVWAFREGERQPRMRLQRETKEPVRS